MTFSTLLRFATAAALITTLVATPATAQTATGDPTGGTGGTTGDPTGGTSTSTYTPVSTGVNVVPAGVFDAIKGWTTARASLEGIALESFPDAIELYARDLDGHYGGLSRHIEASFPVIHRRFVDATGFDPELDVEALLGFMINEDGDAYLSMQRTLTSAAMDFATWSDQHYPILARELALVKSPADEGVRLDDYLYQVGGVELIGQLPGNIGWAPYPDDECACHVIVEDFDKTSAGDLVADSDYESWYKFPNVKVRDWEYTPTLSGAKKQIRYDRRSRNITFSMDRQVESHSTLEILMYCTKGGAKGGEACNTGSCGAHGQAIGSYGSKVWQRIHSAGIKLIGNNADLNVADVANLELRIDGAVVDDNHVNDKGAGDYQHTNNPKADAEGIIKGMVGPVISLVWNIIQTGDFQQAALDWLLDGDAAGIVKYAYDGNDEQFHVKDDDSDTYYWYVDGGGGFTILPNKTYELSMITTSAIDSTGFGDNNWSRVDIDTAYYLAVAFDEYNCTPGVHPPQLGGAFWWGAADQAPLDIEDMQDDLKDFFDDELGINLNPSILEDGNNNREERDDFVID